MEITDLSWNENLSRRFNNPLLPRSIRGLIVGKSGCGKTTLLLNLLLKPGWLDYDPFSFLVKVYSNQNIKFYVPHSLKDYLKNIF